MTLPRGAAFPEFFSLERFAFQICGLSFRGKKRVFPLTSGRAALYCRLAFYLFSKVKRFKRIRAGQRRVCVPLFESGPAGAGESPENFCRHGRPDVPELTKGQARRVCPVALFVREAED